MEASLHPTELCKSLSSSPLLYEEPIYPISTCRRPSLGLSSSVSLFPTSPTHHLTPYYTDPSRMDTDEDGVTDYIELQGWDVIVIHERRGEVMEDRCEYGVWSLPVRFDSEGDGASDETEWKFHGNPDSSDSDKDGIPDREESGPNLTMVEGTPPVILDKKGRDKSSDKYSGAYIKTKVKIKTKWSISGVKIKGKIIVIFTVVDNAGLDRAVIYVQTGGERIIYLGRDKRREIEEVFEIGDLLRLIHGGYDIRVNVTDINGNWATGKTHIDSALQTLKKGLSALLDMIVAALKVIAKVASMLMEVIKKIIMRIIKPILSPIRTIYNDWKDDIISILVNVVILGEKYTRSGESDTKELQNSVDNLLSIITIGTFAILIGVLVTAISTIQLIVSAILMSTGGGTIASLIGDIVLSGMVKLTSNIIMDMVFSSIVGFILGYVIRPESIFTGVAEAFGTTIGIFYITYFIQKAAARKTIGLDEIPQSPKDTDSVSLKLALLGFFIGSISVTILSILKLFGIFLTDLGIKIINIFFAVIGAILCGIGAYISISRPGWSDKIPGVIGKLDEILSVGLLFYAIGRLVQYIERD